MAKPNTATVTPIVNKPKKAKRVKTPLDEANTILRKRAALQKKLDELNASVTPEIRALIEAAEAVTKAAKAKEEAAKETK
jgi:AmiR/NasT family two-component response regulator